MLKIFVGIITAFLAVIGFYALIGSLVGRIFAGDGVVLSILVLQKSDVDTLEVRIVENLNTAVMMKSQKLFLLFCVFLFEFVHSIASFQNLLIKLYHFCKRISM